MKKQLHPLKVILTAAIFSLNVNSLCSQTPSAGLTACYSFNGNANDAINNLHGKDTSVVLAADRNSNANSAYEFSGSISSKITLPNSSIIKTPYLSVSLWIMPLDSVNTQFVVFSKNKSGSNFEGYTLVIINKKFHISKHKPDSGYMSAVDANINMKSLAWQHVVTTCGADSMRIYMNGVRVGSALSKFPIDYDNNGHFVLGGTAESFNLPFKGRLDNVKFYNRELTASEVSQLYASTAECSGITGIADFTKKAGLSIYPNPCENNLNIKQEGSVKNIPVDIYDISGKHVRSEFLEENETELNVSDLNPGMYILKMNEDNAVSILRFIKQ